MELRIKLKNATNLFLLAIIFSVSVACSSNQEENQRVLIFAAASVTNALNEIIQQYEAMNSGEVRVNYGGSQALAQQIASGAPADMFISAGEFPMEFLQERSLITSEPINLLSNRLVIVADQDLENFGSINQVTSGVLERMAIANPELAPAGRYAQGSLETLGMWEDVQDMLILGADVRATLAYVESGNADVAIVYATDAAIANHLKVLDLVPEDTYSSIVYPTALVTNANNRAEAKMFLDFLQSDTAREIFRKHGFTPLG